jgi:hypothetical protein
MSGLGLDEFWSVTARFSTKIIEAIRFEGNKIVLTDVMQFARTATFMLPARAR